MRLLRALNALLRMSFAGMFQYRGEIVLWALWGVVYPAVSLMMWRAAIAGRPGHTDIHGYGPREFAAYFLMTMVMGHVCTAWDLYEMGYQVRSGALSPKLLRPILPIWHSISDNFAYKVLTLAILVPLWAGFAWLTKPAFTAGAAQVAIGLVALVLGAAMNFILGYTLSLAAFWLTRTEAVAESYFGCSLLLGGRLVPLALLPWPLTWVADALPFKWIIWFPAVALSGQIPIEQVKIGIFAQIGWLAFGVFAFKVLWRLAVKRYSAVGA